MKRVFVVALVLLSSAVFCQEKTEKNKNPFSDNTVDSYIRQGSQLSDSIFNGRNIPYSNFIFCIRDSKNVDGFTLTTLRFYYRSSYYATERRISGDPKKLKKMFAEWKERFTFLYDDPYSQDAQIVVWDRDERIVVLAMSTAGTFFSVLVYDYEFVEDLRDNHGIDDPFQWKL